MQFKKLPARFYCTANGGEPVRDWLRGLPVDERRLIGVDIATAEFGWPVGMPTIRPLGKGLFEVRTDLPSGRTARVLFCVVGGEMILLHGIIKKTQQLPLHDLTLALQRSREVR